MITILWIIKVYKSACMKLYDNYSMYFKVIISTELHIYLSETLWKSFYGFQKYAFCMAYTTTCLQLYYNYSMDSKSYLYHSPEMITCLKLYDNYSMVFKSYLYYPPDMITNNAYTNIMDIGYMWIYWQGKHLAC